MIRLWPWTKFAQLEGRIAWHDAREQHHLFLIELKQKAALQAMRDLAAANKGIRRLKAKLKKYEPDTRPHD